MQLTDVDLAEVIESVWTSMLGFELTASDAQYEFVDGRYLVGTVQITGDLDAAVLVETPEALAREVACTMFGMDDAELSDDEVRDALGEMANMIGGNVKGMVAGDTRLSLPTVSEGRDYRVCVPGASLERSFVYSCGESQMRIRMVTRAETALPTESH